jgi:hypothetical protein
MIAEVVLSKLEIETALAVGYHSLGFMKLDGSYRETVATRDMSLVPEAKRPINDGKRLSNAKVVTFYDVTGDKWKSFVAENIVFVETLKG